MNCWVTNNEVNSPRVLNVSLWQHNWLDKQQQQKEQKEELKQKPKRNGTRHNSLSVALFDLIYMPMPAACGAQTDIRDGSHSTVDIYKLQKDDALSASATATGRRLPARQTDRQTGQTWPEDDDDRAKTKANVNEPREWREP